MMDVVIHEPLSVPPFQQTCKAILVEPMQCGIHTFCYMLSIVVSFQMFGTITHVFIGRLHVNIAPYVIQHYFWVVRLQVSSL
jgi:hypothetical protein